MPLVKGRGAGLGNEMINWAKAFIASRALDIPLLHPAWGLNRRRYWELFGTSRSDWFIHKAMWRALPHFEFRESDLDRAGGETFHDAVLRFASKHELSRRSAYILGFGGLWGEYSYIAQARSFLRQQLLNSSKAIENLYEIENSLEQDALRIGVHIRRGDFGAPPTNLEYRGKFNAVIPLEWYTNIARNLRNAFGMNACFVVVSDSTDDELAPFLREFGCITTQHQENRDISDLLLLSSCDFIVCSVSSYSQWAAFLSDSRYAWLAANLTEHQSLGSIWGHHVNQKGLDQEIGRAIRKNIIERNANRPLRPRGTAVAWDGNLPDELFEDLRLRLLTKQRSTDLIRHGAVPVPTATEAAQVFPATESTDGSNAA
ncbi:alpha-1,2-fucosyltransferase [Bradyrhizobium sp. PRIMUS42]|uniref:alpha-1,2-fucosyltransferase n=1 Tax=Bradyrhizobium sp. PRIMUS42 TaxID=2908926 RepID=UPI001FF1C193|nr:alpha-1,2-fucosyltransferase [Bradyrhizobium sp. PRIMUS42]MCJ9729716.1 alpha-1,2-fucosyltransferase [Bradyrhizobium sp. PRIMUS42]